METGKTQLRGTSREGHTANRRRGWIGKLRSTTTQRAEGTARLITTIAVIVALIGGAGPAAAQVLVTNLSEPSKFGYGLGAFDFVQPFTTGTNASGYQLESISINFRQGRSREYEPVYVYGDNGNGRPNHRDQIATPTINGATFEGPVTGVNKYTVRKARCYPQPPHGGGCLSDASSVHLDANTQYWVFVWAGEDKTLVNVDDTGINGLTANRVGQGPSIPRMRFLILAAALACTASPALGQVRQELRERGKLGNVSAQTRLELMYDPGRDGTAERCGGP